MITAILSCTLKLAQRTLREAIKILNFKFFKTFLSARVSLPRTRPLPRTTNLNFTSLFTSAAVYWTLKNSKKKVSKNRKKKETSAHSLLPGSFHFISFFLFICNASHINHLPQ